MTISRAAQLACLLEVAAPKVGNVHPDAPFHDTDCMDFVNSARAIRPVMQAAPQRGLGATVLDAVRATREVTDVNTNLGIILLLAPLCVACEQNEHRGLDPWRDNLRCVLQSLTAEDAKPVYEAIRLAKPGGLGTQTRDDVFAEPPADLIAAMRLAADHDAVARQYVNDFNDVFDRLVPTFALWMDQVDGVDTAIVGLHLEQMAHEPDSLIVRKGDTDSAIRAKDLASQVLRSGWPKTLDGRSKLQELDDWLRQANGRRNPGTSADLVAASLFVALREGIIRPPFTMAATDVDWLDE